MSQRSIVEFDHDQSRAIARQPEHFVILLKRALGSGSADDWDALLPFGVNRIGRPGRGVSDQVGGGEP